MRSIIFSVSLCVTAGLGVVLGQDPALPKEQALFFEANIRPLLIERCHSCHSGTAKKLQAGLRLDGRASLLAGGDSGPAIVPGDPDGSLLMQAVRHESLEMPPQGKLSETQIGQLRQWIQWGAGWPLTSEEGEPTASSPAARVVDFDWQQRRANHWAWQPIQARPPPLTEGLGEPAGPIDRFLLQRLRSGEIRPSGPADRRTLVRRLYFDLIGLPPTLPQMHSFVADDAPDALEKLVDQLLASRHFGEAWARHWLDLVRFAETYGHEFDYPIPHTQPYRDYLIRAFNNDVAYDQLFLEHVAGDLLDPPRRHPTDDYNESVIGTACWRFGEATHSPTDVRADRADRVDNQIDVLCKTFLGLTVSCARCHDHKFDAISTEDYYGLAGVVRSTRAATAMLDPGQQIASHAQSLRQIQSTARAAFTESAPAYAADWFAAELLAHAAKLKKYWTAMKPKDSASSKGETIATPPDKTADNAPWIRALLENPLDSTAHPLHPWRQVVTADDRWPALDQVLADMKPKAPPLGPDDSQRLTRFDPQTDSLEGWTVYGQALVQEAPSGRCLMPADVRGIRLYADGCGLCPPNTVSSRILSQKLEGVLRSPNLVLEAGDVHVLIRADRAQVRLIVEQYRLAKYNPLLFEGTLIKSADTNGQFQWLTLRTGLHAGCDAFLEFVDDGDGFFEVQEVRLGSTPQITPPSVTAELTRRLTALEATASRRDPPGTASGDQPLQQIAAAYGQTWHAALVATLSEKASEGQISLVDWALRHGLLSDYSAFQRQQTKPVEAVLPSPVYALAISDGDGEDCRVFIRGSHERTGRQVARRLPLALAGAQQAVISSGSGRLQLAQRLLQPSSPFLARVAVNRIWHHLFGRGLVPTVDDFGVMGQPPTHPKLLDWLAEDFRQHGWSVKRAIRQMVLSDAYQRGSRPVVESLETDPQNIYWHYRPIRRLTAEAIRDQILTVSGSLVPEIGGPSIEVHLTEFMNGRGRPIASGPLDGAGRRSLYLAQRRLTLLTPMLLVFDFPVPMGTMGRRTISNVPAQALTLMNDPFVLEQAARWADRLLTEYDDDDQRLVALSETALGYPPTTVQLQECRGFLKRQRALYSGDEQTDAWPDLCHTLFNTKQFIYLR